MCRNRTRHHRQLSRLRRRDIGIGRTDAHNASGAAVSRESDYVGTVSTNNGAITLDITVDGDKAIAYACDGNSVEVWLRGSAVDGAVRLASKDRTSSIDGRLRGSTVTGTLAIRGKSWQFDATEVRDPAGLYVDQSDAGRSSWIVDADGSVTGVQRRTDGSTAPAPALTSDATRVNGDTDVV